jgi:hypothetical protein
MCQEQSAHGGPRSTVRHLLIGVAYFVILFSVILPVLERMGQTGTRGALLGALLLSPPLLAFLVVLIDRDGPIKNWAVLFLLLLLYPALALYHDVTVTVDYVANGRVPSLWATLLLNATFLPATVLYGVKLMPRQCPGCRRRTLIPLRQLFKTDPRTATTGWCASCGGKYWRDAQGNWNPERRKTWLDAQDQAPKQDQVQATPDRHAGVRGPVNRPLREKAPNESPPS